MRRKLHGILGEQWDVDGRCGQVFPESELTIQKGIKVCPACLDNLDIERHSQVAARTQSNGIDRELTDRRAERWGFYSGTELNEE